MKGPDFPAECKGVCAFEQGGGQGPIMVFTDEWNYELACQPDVCGV